MNIYIVYNYKTSEQKSKVCRYISAGTLLYLDYDHEDNGEYNFDGDHDEP